MTKPESKDAASYLLERYNPTYLTTLWESSLLGHWNNSSATRPCPVCSSTATIEIHRWAVDNFFYALYDDNEARLDELYLAKEYDTVPFKVLKQFRITIDALLAGKLSVQFLQCQECHSAYQNFPHTAEIISQYYNKYYRIPYEEVGDDIADLRMGRNDDRWVGQQNCLADYVYSLLKDPSKKTALDLGCAEGLACKRLQERGVSAFGIEPSAQMVRFATKTLGIPNITCGAYGESSYAPQQFDIIFSHHVIEHVYDYREVIRAAKLHLKPNGLFLVQTPCIDTFQKEARIRDVLFGGHLLCFSEQSLKLALTREGFTVLETRLTPLSTTSLPTAKQGPFDTSIWGDDAGGISIVAQCHAR